MEKVSEAAQPVVNVLMLISTTMIFIIYSSFIHPYHHRHDFYHLILCESSPSPSSSGRKEGSRIKMIAQSDLVTG